MLAFSWQAIRDRITTKMNLFHRKVLGAQQDLGCVFCNRGMETTDHLFLNCNISNMVWRKVLGWFGIHVALPATFEEMYWLHKGLFVGKKVKEKGYGGLALNWMDFVAGKECNYLLE